VRCAPDWQNRNPARAPGSVRSGCLLAALAPVLGCQPASAASSAFAPTGDPEYTVDFAHPMEIWWCTVRIEGWGQYYCSGGELYIVDHAKAEPRQRITPLSWPFYKNFMLEAAVRSVKSSGSYGICLRPSDEGLYISESARRGNFNSTCN
jgi:hypothetical protein